MLKAFVILPFVIQPALIPAAEGSRIETVLGASGTWTYVWVQGGKKVGQSEFRLDTLKTPAGDDSLWLTATRSYDREGITQKASSSTGLSLRGESGRYEETLEMTSIKGGRSSQKTEILLEGKKARLKYVQNGTAKVDKEVEVAAGAFLLGSQAVEHWAVLLATLEPGFTSKDATVFYPDFGESFTVAFKKEAEQPLKVGAAEVKSIRYSFASTKFAMQGSVWLDEKGRLVQIEFPNARDPNLTLRVTLAAMPANKPLPAANPGPATKG